MDNQDQFNQMTTPQQTSAPAEFSLYRRILTVALVLTAALLLGYVVYSMLLVADPVDNEVNIPVQPEQQSFEEQAMQKLEAFKRESTVPPSEVTVGQLEDYRQEQSAPTQEQLNRLQEFEASY